MVVNTIKPGQTFGEYSFITNNPNKCGAIVEKACTISFLKRSDFLKILSESHVDLE